MHDPKFEREVQQKMEELEFSPSEGVWANLQRELHKEKRRVAPLLWLFFLLGGMLLGAGGATFFYFHRLSPPPYAAAHEKTTGAGGMASGASGINTANRDSRYPGDLAANEKTVNQKTVSEKIVSQKTVSEKMANEKIRNEKWASRNIRHDKTSDRPAGVATGEEFHDAHTMPLNARLALLPMDPGRDPAANWIKIRPAAAGAGVPDFYKSADSRAAKKARFSDKPSWEAGYTGGAGFSSISMSTAIPSFTPATNIPGNSTPGLVSRQSSSPVSTSMRPDLSFWAGIFVQRPVFKKLSVTVGLNLHYYSTRLPTGRKVEDSGSTAPVSLFYAASPYVLPSAPAQTYPYYATGNSNEYRNRYYFMEIPVSVQGQVSHSKRMAISWEGGLSISRLISANALYYNEKSGVYVADGTIANPTHLMAFSSVMAGFSWRGNLIQIGPEGQYGLTSLLNAHSAGSQHLVYAGIKIAVTPRKW